MGKKSQYTCPECHKIVRDLPAHIARMHPDKKDTTPTTPTTPKAQPKGKQLEIKKPAQVKAKEEPAPTGYHCLNCGGSVSKGQDRCPQCGERLDWSQV